MEEDKVIGIKKSTLKKVGKYLLCGTSAVVVTAGLLIGYFVLYICSGSAHGMC